MSSGRLLKLLDAAKGLPDKDQRKVAALVGACVADAAARPLHWVYDMSALNQYLKADLGGVDRTAEPEFYPENKSPFYNLPTGENSCYWDIGQAVLGTLESGYDFKKVCAGLEDRFFGPETDYSLEKRQNFMTLRAMGMAPAEPIDGRWMNGSLIKFKENLKSGKKPYGDPHIKETDGFIAALPVVLKLADDPDVLTKAEDVIKTLSSWPTSVSHGVVACNIMVKMVNGRENEAIQEAKKEAIDTHPDVAKNLANVDKVLGTDHTTAVGFVFGRPCYNPGSFQGAIHAVLTSEDYATAVRKTIRAGGCCCSRALFIGAMAGAKYGLSGIPQDWLERSFNAEKVLQLSIDAFKN